MNGSGGPDFPPDQTKQECGQEEDKGNEKKRSEARFGNKHHGEERDCDGYENADDGAHEGIETARVSRTKGEQHRDGRADQQGIKQEVAHQVVIGVEHKRLNIHSPHQRGLIPKTGVDVSPHT